MKKIRRKITLASIAVLALLATTVTTTFAWFSMNDSAWLEGMNLEVEASGNLFITSDYRVDPTDEDISGLRFKQYLTAEDIVKAINNLNPTDISSLSEIELKPVTTVDTLTFQEQKVTYDSMNKQTIEFVEAGQNSYIKMQISFTVENNGSDKPDYELKFALENIESVIKTTFASSNQTVSLVNKLINYKQVYSVVVEENEDPEAEPTTTYTPLDRYVESEADLTDEEKLDLEAGKIVLRDVEMHTGQQLTVNPVNALRIAVINESDDTYIEVPDESNPEGNPILKPAKETIYIYDIGKSSKTNSNSNVNLGGNATEDVYLSHPSLTYFNNIHGTNVPAMKTPTEAELEQKNIEIVHLDELDNVLGTFKADDNGVYNVVTLTVMLWIEGYDADNLIGLNTSDIQTLLTFVAEEK